MLYIVNESVQTSSVVFLIQNWKGYVRKYKRLKQWRHKDYRAIYRLWRWKLVKQNELDGDSKFTTTIGLGGKSVSYWKINKRQSWNGEEYVGLIGGITWSILGVFREGKLSTKISMNRNAILYPPEWMGAIYFSIAICSSELKRSGKSKDLCSTWSTIRNFKSIVDE